MSTWENLHQRLLFGGAAALLAAFLMQFIYHPYLSFLFPLSATVVVLFAQKEYYAISEHMGLHPGFKVGMCGSVCLIFSIYFGLFIFSLPLLPIVALSFAFLAIFSSYLVRGRDPLVNIAMTFFGIVYLAIPIGCAVVIPYLKIDGARLWLVMLIAMTYMTDTFALIAGKLFGTHQLAPYTSPNKTWEGAIGGLLASIATALCFAYLFSVISLPMALFLGSGVGILAQLGDLSESLLKRNVGVKDSAQIPGLGGALDVIDSLLFTAPFFLITLLFLLK